MVQLAPALLLILFVERAAGLRLASPEEDVELNLEDADDKQFREDFEKELQSFQAPKELVALWAASGQNEDQCVDSIKSFLSRKPDVDYESLDCADPWSGSPKECQEGSKLPGYRLGDVVRKCRSGNDAPSSDELKSYHLKHFPKSIASKYLKQKKTHHEKSARDERYFDQHTDLYAVISLPEYEVYEKPAPTDMVVHLRIGDVVQHCGSDFWNDKPCHRSMFNENKYVRGRSYWMEQIEANEWTGVQNVMIVCGGTKASDKSSVAEEYIDRVADLFKSHTNATVTKRVNGNPDCDFIFMANAHKFIGTGGGYDRLVREMHKCRDLPKCRGNEGGKFD